MFKSYSCQVLRYNAARRCVVLHREVRPLATTITIYPLVSFQTWKFRGSRTYLACRVSEYLAEFVCIRLSPSCTSPHWHISRSPTRAIAFPSSRSYIITKKSNLRVSNTLKPLFLFTLHDSTDRKRDEKESRMGRESLLSFDLE